MHRIACLHTALSNRAVFEGALLDLGIGDEVALRHEVRADLLADAESADRLTPGVMRRTGEALLALCGQADAVLLTCSTLGPSLAAIAGRAPVPVLRVDAALAREAVRDGGRVVVLCAVRSTLEATRILFEEAARDTGAGIEVRVVPDAWTAFRAGEHERYLALVARAADEAARQGAMQVALAQASMAGAASLVSGRLRPLTSPAVGLRAALAAAAEA